jgi:hypothetical protein
MVIRVDDLERVLDAEISARRLTLPQARALLVIWRSFRTTTTR